MRRFIVACMAWIACTGCIDSSSDDPDTAGRSMDGIIFEIRSISADSTEASGLDRRELLLVTLTADEHLIVPVLIQRGKGGGMLDESWEVSDYEVATWYYEWLTPNGSRITSGKTPISGGEIRISEVPSAFVIPVIMPTEMGKHCIRVTLDNTNVERGLMMHNFTSYGADEPRRVFGKLQSGTFCVDYE